MKGVLRNTLEREVADKQGVARDRIDFHAEIDSSLSYSENKQNLLEKHRNSKELDKSETQDLEIKALHEQREALKQAITEIDEKLVALGKKALSKEQELKKRLELSVR